MRTRSQKREYMQEVERKREAAATALVPAKKHKTMHKTQPERSRHTDKSAVPMTPHHRPRVAQTHKTPRKFPKTALEPASGKRGSLRRSLPCSTSSTIGSDEVSDNMTPTVLKKDAPVAVREKSSALPNDIPAVLQRVAAGQMLRSPAIVGRSAEHEAVRAVLEGGATSTRSSLFIIGPPGTGKSSSVDALLSKQGYILLREDAAVTHERKGNAGKSGKAAVKLNCSAFTSPEALYAEIAQQLRQAADVALPAQFNPYALSQFLEELEVSSSESRAKSRAKEGVSTVVVVLDEVDQLLRLPVHVQPQVKEVLGFLVRWAALVPTAMKFLGVMNGVDMYQQVSRVHSRDISGDQDTQVPRVIFASYAHAELVLILESYVASAQSQPADVACVIEPRAVELIARKVAARDGDARRAISLLQQCARHALRRTGLVSSPKAQSALPRCNASSQPGITLRDVMQCATAMLSSPVVQQISQLPRQPKLVLFAITSLAPSSGNDNAGSSPRVTRRCDMNAVNDELARLRAAQPTAWVPRFSREELQTHLATLDCYALVKRSGRGVPSGRAFWTAKLSSGVTLAEVTRAVADDALLSQLST